MSRISLMLFCPKQKQFGKRQETAQHNRPPCGDITRLCKHSLSSFVFFIFFIATSSPPHTMKVATSDRQDTSY